MNPHTWPAIITLLAVVVMAWTGMRVARARARYGIVAPATTGNVDFERVFRVQMNTMEQALIFLPVLWLAAAYSYSLVVAIAGLAWVLGRILYVLAYTREASRRGTGFTIAAVAFIVLLVAAVIGVGRSTFGI